MLLLPHSENLPRRKVANLRRRTGEQQNAAGICGGECAPLFGEKPDASLEFQRTRELTPPKPAPERDGDLLYGSHLSSAHLLHLIRRGDSCAAQVPPAGLPLSSSNRRYVIEIYNTGRYFSE